MRHEGRQSLMLAALLLVVAAAIVVLFTPIVPLAGPALPLALVALAFLGIQYAIFRAAGLRSSADRERPADEDDEADDEAWRG